jgi:DNA-binding transcriptional ArsR family regulator
MILLDFTILITYNELDYHHLVWRIEMRLRKDSDEILEDDILFLSKVSDALAHPARIKILTFIFQNNRSNAQICNKDVVAHFNYSQATISQHIKKLTDANLIQIKKSDRFSFYYTNIGLLSKYVNTLKKLNF